MSETLEKVSAIERFEKIAVYFLMFLLVVLIIFALIQLVVLMFIRIPQEVMLIDTVTKLQDALQRGFGGVLAVLVGLELLETLKVYSREHRIRLEVILIVAMIATGRHIVQLDVHHSQPLLFFGLAVLTLSLAVSYYLIKRSSTTNS